VRIEAHLLAVTALAELLMALWNWSKGPRIAISLRLLIKYFLHVEEILHKIHTLAYRTHSSPWVGFRILSSK